MSKRAEYSPGPWTLHEYEDDGVHLADVFDTYQECKTACLNIADARLIGAAPDLLEALEEAVKDLVAAQVNARRASKWDQAWSGVAEAIQPSVDKARAAISKAKGADHEQAI